MTNSEILDKVIKKAVGNGLDKEQSEAFFEAYEYFGGTSWKDVLRCALIFSPEFAKAYWGEHDSRYRGQIPFNSSWAKDRVLKEWEVRLMFMVLEEDKFKYLEKFI